MFLDIEKQAMRISPFLVCYFNRQDRARRFVTPGFMTRELSSYYATEQRKQAQALLDSALKVRMLKNIQKQIKQLLRRAEKAKGEELRKIGGKIETLYRQAEDLDGSAS